VCGGLAVISASTAALFSRVRSGGRFSSSASFYTAAAPVWFSHYRSSSSFFFPDFDFFGSKSCHMRCSQGELFPLVLLPSQRTVQFSMPFSFLLALWRSVFAALTVGTAFPLGGCSGHASPHRSRAKRAGPCTSSSSYSASADRSPDSICVAHKRLCLSIPQSAH
jgi:hypothetical protein